MHYRFISGLVTICALSTWKVLHDAPKDEKMDQMIINPSFQKQSQKKVTVGRNVVTTVMEPKKHQMKQTDDLRPQPSKDSIKRNLQDQQILQPEFTNLSGSLPLDTIFFLLLIHSCGADLVATIATVCHSLCSVAGLIELTLSATLAVFAAYKWKRERARLLEKNAELQEESLQKEREQEDVVTTLMEVKAELQNQSGLLKVLLEEVERGREENKQTLQSVEKEIMEREIMFEKPEELLRRKEKLLNEHWRLDQRKKNHEKQLLDNERLLEPIEIQIPKLHRNRK
ncbi:uncharacterized protein [Channa argus]|uniref:uncharacterized protein n=1 Tax=Channa argus TaxID=215402 RepID=UPI0029461F47|nr:hypothetical protein Q8A73_012702 [Channa argus]